MEWYGSRKCGNGKKLCNMPSQICASLAIHMLPIHCAANTKEHGGCILFFKPKYLPLPPQAWKRIIILVTLKLKACQFGRLKGQVIGKKHLIKVSFKKYIVPIASGRQWVVFMQWFGWCSSWRCRGWSHLLIKRSLGKSLLNLFGIGIQCFLRLLQLQESFD